MKLTAVDLNGDSQTIGEASTDIAGKFGKSWTPTVEGDYMIVATFEGTESFGSSLDTTYLTVGSTTTEPTPAPTPTPTPTPTPSPSPLPSPGPGEPAAPINMYLIAAAVAVVAVIVVAVIFLRRRK